MMCVELIHNYTRHTFLKLLFFLSALTNVMIKMFDCCCWFFFLIFCFAKQVKKLQTCEHILKLKEISTDLICINGCALSHSQRKISADTLTTIGTDTDTLTSIDTCIDIYILSTLSHFVEQNQQAKRKTSQIMQIFQKKKAKHHNKKLYVYSRQMGSVYIVCTCSFQLMYLQIHRQHYIDSAILTLHCALFWDECTNCEYSETETETQTEIYKICYVKYL